MMSLEECLCSNQLAKEKKKKKEKEEEKEEGGGENSRA